MDETRPPNLLLLSCPKPFFADFGTSSSTPSTSEQTAANDAHRLFSQARSLARPSRQYKETRPAEAERVGFQVMTLMAVSAVATEPPDAGGPAPSPSAPG